MIMKKYFLFLILIPFYFSCKETTKITDSVVKQSYWYFIDIEIKKDDITGMKKFTIKRIHDKIYKGNSKDFFKINKENLKKNLISIGPFLTENAAKESQIIYKLEKIEELESHIEIKKNVFWYALKLIKKDTGEWAFSSSPVLVNERSINTFFNYLNEGLSFGIFAFGPFNDKLTAEESLKINLK